MQNENNKKKPSFDILMLLFLVAFTFSLTGFLHLGFNDWRLYLFYFLYIAGTLRAFSVGIDTGSEIGVETIERAIKNLEALAEDLHRQEHQKKMAAQIAPDPSNNLQPPTTPHAN